MAHLQVVLTVTAPLLVGVIGLGVVQGLHAMRDLCPGAFRRRTPRAGRPAQDPRLLTAAVVLDHSATQVSDFVLLNGGHRTRWSPHRHTRRTP